MAGELHSVIAAAKVLGVSRWTVYRLIAAGDLDAVDIAPTGCRRPRTRVPAESIKRFTAARTHNARALRAR